MTLQEFFCTFGLILLAMSYPIVWLLYLAIGVVIVLGFIGYKIIQNILTANRDNW